MKTVSLGQTDVQIAPLVFGGNVFGWTVDQQQSFTLLDACVDLGINMIDTADMYSTWVSGNQGGESETLIGKWLKQSGKRDQVVLGTKVGMDMPAGSGLSREYILKAADASLTRLQTDYIDVYYAHQDDPNTPMEETFSAFQTLIDSGKVKHIACSNFSPERLAEAMQFARNNNLPQYIAHQPEYNLFDRSGYEGALEATCKEFNLGVVSYFSLASGFLSGKYRSAADLETSNRGADFLRKYLNERGLNILSALDQIASQHQVPVSAVSLAWIRQRDSVTAPIASATRVEQLEQLVVSTELNLTNEDMALLNQASAS